MKKSSKSDIRVLWLLAIILIICFLIIGVLFFKYFYSGINTSKYGNRLEDISSYPLSKNLADEINGLYDSEESVGDVVVNVQGRIIYINIDFVKTLKVDVAQNLAIKALDKIGEENLTYYEVQFLLTYSGEDENNNFPIFGSKNSNSLKVVW